MRRAGLTLVVVGLAACGGAANGPRDAERSRAQARGDDPGLEGKVDDELAVSLAETLIRSGAHANAVPILRAALDRKPQDARLHYLLGTVLRDRGVYDQAERELALAIQLDPDMPPAYAGLAMLHDLRGRHEAALPLHRKAIALAPGVPRFHNNLGFSRYLAGEPAAAMAAYEEALRLEPTATQVYVNLGFALAALGRDDEALRVFRQAGGDGPAYNNLALAHELRGDPERARDLYREAMLRAPDLAAPLRNLDAMGAVDRPVAGPAPEEARP